nr:protein-tyrosine-phosphatase PTP1 [Ipomoea batatas]
MSLIPFNTLLLLDLYPPTEDFWEMVIQNCCPAIVMLTRLVDNYKTEKCGDYFQAEDGVREFGNICITTKWIKTTDTSLILRCLEVSYKESEQPPLSVLHVQYAEWPDHGVPKDTLAAREIVKWLHTLPPSLGPIVVHCSADRSKTKSVNGEDKTKSDFGLFVFCLLHWSGEDSSSPMEETNRLFVSSNGGDKQTVRLLSSNGGDEQSVRLLHCWRRTVLHWRRRTNWGLLQWRSDFVFFNGGDEQTVRCSNLGEDEQTVRCSNLGEDELFSWEEMNALVLIVTYLIMGANHCSHRRFPRPQRDAPGQHGGPGAIRRRIPPAPRTCYSANHCSDLFFDYCFVGVEQ